MGPMIVAILLVQLTGPDGSQRIDINANEVTSIREPRADAGEHFAKGTHCVIVMTSGTFVAVSEDCATVRQRLGPQGSCTLVCGSQRP
jgi:hypothetical protein